MTPFADAQVDAIRNLQAACGDVPFVLVGAMALHCHFDKWEGTRDLGFTVAASVDELESIARRLTGWKRDPRREHEWTSPGGVLVDLLPAGPEILNAGEITWPGSGRRMNMTGFRLVLDWNVPIAIDSGEPLRVAPVPAIVLLKMAASSASLSNQRQVVRRWMIGMNSSGSMFKTRLDSPSRTVVCLCVRTPARGRGPIQLDRQSRRGIDGGSLCELLNSLPAHPATWARSGELQQLQRASLPFPGGHRRRGRHPDRRTRPPLQRALFQHRGEAQPSRTPLTETAGDTITHHGPIHGLNCTFRNFARTPTELGDPRGIYTRVGRPIKAVQQVVGKSGAIPGWKGQRGCAKFLGGHGHYHDPILPANQ